MISQTNQTNETTPSIQANDSAEQGREVVAERVVKAAHKLFAQYGIKSVSMDDIARAAGMSKRTLYQIFDDKEDLLIATIDLHGKEMELLAKEMNRNSETILDAILAFYAHMARQSQRFSPKFQDDIKRYPKAVERLQEGRDDLFRSCMEVFQLGVEQGVFTNGINFEIVAFLFREQIETAIPSKLFAKYSIQEVYSTVLLAFLRGICTEKGLKICDKFTEAQKKKGIH